jgi:RNA-directed DNA polymerase
MAPVTAFLEGRLRLKVNQRKSAVAPVGERQFLDPTGQARGHAPLGKGGSLGIGRKSLDRAKDRLRQATRRNRGVSLERMVAEANRFIVGWVSYYRNARCRSALLDLDGWLRRKFRCVRIKQCKNPSALAAFLQRNAVRERPARQLASSGKGWWRLPSTGQVKRAMPNEWFDDPGPVRMAGHHAALNSAGNRRGTCPVRPVM